MNRWFSLASYGWMCFYTITTKSLSAIELLLFLEHPKICSPWKHISGIWAKITYRGNESRKERVIGGLYCCFFSGTSPKATFPLKTANCWNHVHVFLCISWRLLSEKLLYQSLVRKWKSFALQTKSRDSSNSLSSEQCCTSEEQKLQLALDDNNIHSPYPPPSHFKVVTSWILTNFSNHMACFLHALNNKKRVFKKIPRKERGGGDHFLFAYSFPFKRNVPVLIN